MNVTSRDTGVLVADVGGTHVRFALADVSAADPLRTDTIRRYDAADFKNFNDAMRRYLDESRARPRSAVIATAGLRVGDEVRLTNLPWVISRSGIEAEFGLSPATLINDFAAMAMCVLVLRPGDMQTLGTRSSAPIDAATERTFAIVGPGTGLGVGALLLRDGRPYALETEGGHTSLAPNDDEEIEILRRLSARFGRVSNERILCGSGLVNLYDVLCEMRGAPAAMTRPEDITRHADDDADCRRAVERFCEVLGALAGDLALVFGAWDGVFLTGGIAPAIARWLAAGGFRRRFENKGRMSAAMARVPTSLVLNPDAGLLGAAAFARSAASSNPARA